MASIQAEDSVSVKKIWWRLALTCDGSSRRPNDGGDPAVARPCRNAPPASDESRGSFHAAPVVSTVPSDGRLPFLHLNEPSPFRKPGCHTFCPITHTAVLTSGLMNKAWAQLPRSSIDVLLWLQLLSHTLTAGCQSVSAWSHLNSSTAYIS